MSRSPTTPSTSKIELPGVKSKDINVEANGQELVVTGEIKEKERKGVLRFCPCPGGPSATDPQNSKISDKVRLRRRLVPAKYAVRWKNRGTVAGNG